MAEIHPVGTRFERKHRYGRRVLELVETVPEDDPANDVHSPWDRHRMRTVVDDDSARPAETASCVGDEFWVEDAWFIHRTDFKKLPKDAP